MEANARTALDRFRPSFSATRTKLQLAVRVDVGEKPLKPESESVVLQPLPRSRDELPERRSPLVRESDVFRRDVEGEGVGLEDLEDARTLPEPGAVPTEDDERGLDADLLVALEGAVPLDDLDEPLPCARPELVARLAVNP